ncbi:OmpA family protein [Mesorhizobium sp. SP-1A]|uniref:OmpA family protein n=1 Tax=Mesorhizobium sp. SP-1A TaxID=3077840 RepID=UPI0028F70169|nr:OmpA family protein [Mesorhizobium sp. SP-1A]
MKRQPRILAGTALGLLMASAPLGAFSFTGIAQAQEAIASKPMILAQTDCQGEDCAAPAQDEQAPRKERRKKQEEQQGEKAPAGEAAPKRKAVEESAPTEQQSQEPEQKPRKERRKAQEQQNEAAPAEAAPAQAEQPAQEPAQKLRKERRKAQEQQNEAAPAEAAPAQAEQPAQEPAQKLRKERRKAQEQQNEAAPAEAAPAQAEQPAQEPAQKLRKERRKAQEQQNEAAPAEKAPAENAPAENGMKPTQAEKPAAQPEQKTKEGKHRKPAESEQTTAPESAPVPEKKAEPQQEEAQPTRKKPAAEQPAQAQPEQPATEQSGEQKAPAGGEQTQQGEASGKTAPILDSQKDAQQPAGEGTKNRRDRNGRKPGETGTEGGAQTGTQAGGQEAQRPAPVDQGPPPADDKAAQQAIRPEKIEPVTELKGKRIDREPNRDIRERPRPEGADVLKSFGDRVIIQFNNETMVESDERPRMRHGSKDVYYEDLPRGQTRETIVRDNGVQIVTIRNRNGDVIRRSRVTPDGREYVLNYVDEQHYQDVRDWRDPGDDLPPLQLDIPRERYILDSESVQGPDDYYEFLEQPPVERVQRLYSIDEVKRSARVRDIARRIDLDTLNFDFGSASISDSEAQKLEGVAEAMQRLLKKNPAETFLIEGHTDAVGSDTANLALSDQRAEAVAEALSNMFEIPPENLTTQGYGERYLKVNTQGPERQNRRVAIRRITPLVAPAVSAN